MEKLEHPLWIVQAVNALLGPIVAAALAPLGFHFTPGQVIPAVPGDVPADRRASSRSCVP